MCVPECSGITTRPDALVLASGAPRAWWLENDANRVRTAVPAHVGERLFDDAIEVECSRRPQRRRPASGHVQLGADSRLLFESGQQTSDGVHEGVVDALLPAELMKELAEALKYLSGRVLNRVQPNQHIPPTDRLSLEILEVHEHAGKGLGYPIV